MYPQVLQGRWPVSESGGCRPLQLCSRPRPLASARAACMAGQAWGAWLGPQGPAARQDSWPWLLWAQTLSTAATFLFLGHASCTAHGRDSPPGCWALSWPAASAGPGSPPGQSVASWLFDQVGCPWDPCCHHTCPFPCQSCLGQADPPALLGPAAPGSNAGANLPMSPSALGTADTHVQPQPDLHLGRVREGGRPPPPQGQVACARSAQAWARKDTQRRRQQGTPAV